LQFNQLGKRPTIRYDLCMRLKSPLQRGEEKKWRCLMLHEKEVNSCTSFQQPSDYVFYAVTSVLLDHQIIRNKWQLRVNRTAL
jgi:hypothetical protein